MDIAFNKLNSTIPVALQELKLQHLNLSSNKLIGEVSIMGNPGLYGTVIGLPSCSHSNQKHCWLLLIPIVIGIAILTIWFLFLHFRMRCKDPSTPVFKLEPTRISYEELINTTTGFSEANMLGFGSFGSVYRGILNNGRNIAIKVLNLRAENAQQSFSRECDVLISVRHRNVIRIITTYSNDDFKAITFPFMLNGNLESLLYLAGEEECRLNLRERVRMSMEVAQGLEYLHHHCFGQVVHCDLKPRDDLTAYVSDFGFSKLVLGNSSGSLASSNALKGSIGYMALEYGAGGKVWINGDVYSYGILLLEVLTRKRPTDNKFVEGMNLSRWVRIHFPNRVTEVVDNNLLRDANESEESQVRTCLTQLLQVGLVCARESPQERPTMIEVVKRLDVASHTLLGMPRAFELLVEISSLIMSTRRASNDKLGDDNSCSSSTA